MSKTILAKANGFTPLIDSMVQKHGMVTAAVFGKVWRYCQLESGTCTASQDRLADELGISRKSINRHLAILVSNGFLNDLTPDLKNKPHRYTDTGKAGLEITINAIGSTVTESPSDQSSVTLSPSAVTLSPSDCNFKSHEESIKESIKESKTDVKREREENEKFSKIVDAFTSKKKGFAKYPKDNPFDRVHKWQDPIGDFLDFANGDAGIVITAMTAAIDKQRADGYSTDTPRSVYKNTKVNIENILNPPKKKSTTKKSGVADTLAMLEKLEI